MTIFNLITLFGGLALFLYGMRLMGDGLKKGSSDAFKRAMEKVTNNPLVGFLLGLVVTAVIQSSTATIVLTSGLVGAVNTVPARKSRGIRRSHLLLRAGTSGKGLGTLLRTLRQSICADQKEENADGGKVFVYIIAQFFQYICKRQI